MRSWKSKSELIRKLTERYLRRSYHFVWSKSWKKVAFDFNISIMRIQIQYKWPTMTAFTDLTRRILDNIFKTWDIKNSFKANLTFDIYNRS